MKVAVALWLTMSASAYAQEIPAADAKPAPAKPALPLANVPAAASDDAVRAAIKAVLEEERAAQAAAPQPPQDSVVLSGESSYSRFGKSVSEARTPSCLHPDAMKFNPAHIGPIQIVGIFSLPWLVGAAVQGKCN
ncbi:hypothetical protein ACLB1G_19490 [Oxalobacteraceae bacterium A2-2]